MEKRWGGEGVVVSSTETKRCNLGGGGGGGGGGVKKTIITLKRKVPEWKFHLRDHRHQSVRVILGQGEEGGSRLLNEMTRTPSING